MLCVLPDSNILLQATLHSYQHFTASNPLQLSTLYSWQHLTVSVNDLKYIYSSWTNKEKSTSLMDRRLHNPITRDLTWAPLFLSLVYHEDGRPGLGCSPSSESNSSPTMVAITGRARHALENNCSSLTSNFSAAVCEALIGIINFSLLISGNNSSSWRN